MSPARLSLWIAAVSAVALGIVAEWAAYDVAAVHLWLPDLVVGWMFVGCGLAGLAHQPTSRTGALMAATGFSWFAGNFAGVEPEVVAWISAQGVYLHRGFLAHAIVTYPGGSTPTRSMRVVVGSGYVVALLPAVWADAVTTVALCAAFTGYCAYQYRTSRGAPRRSRRLALWAAAGVGTALAAGAIARVTLPAADVSRPSLLAYQGVLCLVAGGFLVRLITSGDPHVDVMDLVVQLGSERTGTLRAALSKALGDPSLEIGYWSEAAGGFLAPDGRTLALPAESSGRTITYVDIGGAPSAAIVHDPTVLTDPALRAAVTRATTLAAANSQLLGELHARVGEVTASRRRILDTRDDERRVLERRLNDGGMRQLRQVSEILHRARSAADHDTREQVTRAEEQVTRSLEELQQLARGIHPRVLSEQGLAGAVRSLVQRFPLPVDLTLDGGRLPTAIEGAAYFVCAEALANVVKYASASRARVSLLVEGARLVVLVEDDGVGGADPARGSGLRGLADRVATLGGTIRVESDHGRGTRLAAEIPLGGEER